MLCAESRFREPVIRWQERIVELLDVHIDDVRLMVRELEAGTTALIRHASLSQGVDAAVPALSWTALASIQQLKALLFVAPPASSASRRFQA
jgi:hypothetical protein